MDLELMADIHKALGDKTRLKILALLKSSELCVCELVPILKMTQPAISQHMRKLKNAKLVKERRAGQWVFYSLAGEGVPFLEGVLAELPDLSGEVQMLKDEGLKVVCCD